MENLLPLLQASLGIVGAEVDAAIIRENYAAMRTTGSDVLWAMKNQARAGHIEFSQFAPQGRA